MSDDTLTTSSESEAERISDFERRLAEVNRLDHDGKLAWTFRCEPTHRAAEAAALTSECADGESLDLEVVVAARLRGIRTFGKLMFLVLNDVSGSIQVLVARDAVGDEAFAAFKRLDLGDWVAVRGKIGRSKKGEPTIFAESGELIGKALRQAPESWRGISDPDVRYRRRYLDLIANDDSRAVFVARSAIISTMRRVLEDQRFIEVETPILNGVATGAAARPFETFHNALSMELVLRIAPELYLKRLIVGGLDRVFEIGRVFRNEGLSTRHNPEFTMVECYQAYADYGDMMTLCETLFVACANAANGHSMVTIESVEVDLAQPWRRATMLDLVTEAVGVEVHPSMELAEARAVCDRHEVSYEPTWTSGKILTVLFEELVESQLIAPTFVCDHPLITSPLARTHREDPAFTERFELFVGGRELANAYSELIDPIEQRRRFEQQAGLRADGDDEAFELDEDYLLAMEYGMPPIGGMGIGIDRLVMLLTGTQSIREVLLFPTLRPEAGRPAPPEEVER